MAKGVRADLISQGVLSLLLSVLAMDLLYLYREGAWYDPLPLIEKSEVTLLTLFSVAGIANGIRCLVQSVRR